MLNGLVAGCGKPVLFFNQTTTMLYGAATVLLFIVEEQGAPAAIDAGMEGTTIMRMKKNWLTRLACVGLACGMGVLGGCDCDGHAQDMEDRANRFFAARKRCCDLLAALNSADAAAECYSRLAADTGTAGNLILAWQIACEQNNQALMNDILNALRVATRIAEACVNPLSIPGLILNGAHVANVASPFSEIDSIDMDWRPLQSDIGSADHTQHSANHSRHGGTVGLGNGFSGRTCIQTDAVVLCGRTVGRVEWNIAPFSADENQVRWKPTAFVATTEVAGETIQLTLAEFVQNEIIFNADGQGVFRAAVSIEAPAALGIFQDHVWIELPCKRTLQGLAFTAQGISGLTIARQMPHAFADWNRDWVVDPADYAAFFTDVAMGNADIDFDGDTDQDDIDLFEYLYAEESSG